MIFSKPDGELIPRKTTASKGRAKAASQNTAGHRSTHAPAPAVFFGFNE
jgi:hypothetical protein